MNRLLQLFSLFMLLFSLPAIAQIGDLAQIKEQRHNLDVVSDELMSTRVRLLAQTDSIDMLVDSLRLNDPESSDLLKARIASHQLVVRLDTIDMALDTVRAHSDSLDESLRDAYDWQIARLLGMLTESFDEGLYQQLTLYQEERHELGLPVLRSPSFTGDDTRLSLSEDDGPTELQMKIQLAQDQVSRYRRESDHIEETLIRLDRDVQLVAKMWQLHQQFDRLRQRNHQIMREFNAPAPPSGGQPVVSGGDLQHSYLPRSDQAPAIDSETTPALVQIILVQITRLKAKQQESEAIGAVWEERLGAFHERLEEMLGPSAETR